MSLQDAAPLAAEPQGETKRENSSVHRSPMPSSVRQPSAATARLEALEDKMLAFSTKSDMISAQLAAVLAKLDQIDSKPSSASVGEHRPAATASGRGEERKAAVLAATEASNARLLGVTNTDRQKIVSALESKVTSPFSVPPVRAGVGGQKLLMDGWAVEFARKAEQAQARFDAGAKPKSLNEIRARIAAVKKENATNELGAFMDLHADFVFALYEPRGFEATCAYHCAVFKVLSDFGDDEDAMKRFFAAAARGDSLTMLEIDRNYPIIQPQARTFARKAVGVQRLRVNRGAGAGFQSWRREQPQQQHYQQQAQSSQSADAAAPRSAFRQQQPRHQQPGTQPKQPGPAL